MINKERITRNFQKEEIDDVVRVYEKYTLAINKQISIFTNEFVTPNIWSFFTKDSDIKNIVETNGGFEESERRVLSFNNFYKDDYPIAILEIKNKSKFSDLKHKDYLGAIISLGIDRCRIGDLRVHDNKAYVPVINEISAYIINNLVKICTSPVVVNVVEDVCNIPSVTYEEKVIMLSSLRLDNIVSKIANVSRSKSLELIDEGKILVDYNKVNSKKQEISEETRITIRGVGKFIVGGNIGTTKSGKNRIIIKKYI